MIRGTEMACGTDVETEMVIGTYLGNEMVSGTDLGTDMVSGTDVGIKMVYGTGKQYLSYPDMRMDAHLYIDRDCKRSHIHFSTLKIEWLYKSCR
ncbi:hypothetical protein KUTeg_014956 [Tegillarca granosa]|uniref:Uncharacterized protein n=1 Tax=Tegillarca granosa TaxID=220873 RepID=A0ABQ9ESD8_TEGGR|nr:hypothetical protein KUTeg_014956 [Tegillarca granosa]